MTQQGTVVNHGEALYSLFRQGITGELLVDEFQAALKDFQQATKGARFELHINDATPQVVFCAGSWAVGQLYGSHEIATRVTVLGETPDGPQEIDISRYHNPLFGITQKDAQH